MVPQRSKSLLLIATICVAAVYVSAEVKEELTIDVGEAGAEYPLPGIDFFKMGVNAVTGESSDMELFQFYYPKPNMAGYPEQGASENERSHIIFENNADGYMLPAGFTSNGVKKCSFQSDVTFYHYSSEYQSENAANVGLSGLQGALSLDASVSRVQKTMSTHEKSMAMVKAPCTLWQVNHLQTFMMSDEFLEAFENVGLVKKVTDQVTDLEVPDTGRRVPLPEEETAVINMLQMEENANGDKFGAISNNLDTLLSDLSEVVSRLEAGHENRKGGLFDSILKKKKDQGAEKDESAKEEPKSESEAQKEKPEDDKTAKEPKDGGMSATVAEKADVLDPQKCLDMPATTSGVKSEDGIADHDPCNGFIKRCANHQAKDEAEKVRCHEYVNLVEKKYIKVRQTKIEKEASSGKATKDSDISNEADTIEKLGTKGSCIGDHCFGSPHDFFPVLFSKFGTHFVSKAGLGGLIKMSKVLDRNVFHEESTTSIGAGVKADFEGILGKQAATEDSEKPESAFEIVRTLPDGTKQVFKAEPGDAPAEESEDKPSLKKTKVSNGASGSITKGKQRESSSEKVNIETAGGEPGSMGSGGTGWGDWAQTVHKAPVLVNPYYESICRLLSFMQAYPYHNADPTKKCEVGADGNVNCVPTEEPSSEYETFRYLWTSTELSETRAFHLRRICEYRMREYTASIGKKPHGVYDLYLVLGLPKKEGEGAFSYYAGSNLFLTIYGEYGIIKDVPLTNYMPDQSLAFMPGRGVHFHIDNYAGIGPIKKISLSQKLPGVSDVGSFEPKPVNKGDCDLSKMKSDIRVTYDQARIVDLSSGDVYFFFGSEKSSLRVLGELSDTSSSTPAPAQKGAANDYIFDYASDPEKVAEATPANAEEVKSQHFYEIIVKVHSKPGSGSASEALSLIVEGDEGMFTVSMPLEAMRVVVSSTSDDRVHLQNCFESQNKKIQDGAAKSGALTVDKLGKKKADDPFKRENVSKNNEEYFGSEYRKMKGMKDKTSADYNKYHTAIMACSNHGLAGNVGIYHFKNIPMGRLYSVSVDNFDSDGIRIEHIDIVHLKPGYMRPTVYRGRFPNKVIGFPQEDSKEQSTADTTTSLKVNLFEIGQPVQDASQRLVRDEAVDASSHTFGLNYADP